MTTFGRFGSVGARNFGACLGRWRTMAVVRGRDGAVQCSVVVVVVCALLAGLLRPFQDPAARYSDRTWKTMTRTTDM
jgi:hypothetical protein